LQLPEGNPASMTVYRHVAFSRSPCKTEGASLTWLRPKVYRSRLADDYRPDSRPAALNAD
jgi:hypothetical protein